MERENILREMASSFQALTTNLGGGLPIQEARNVNLKAWLSRLEACFLWGISYCNTFHLFVSVH